MNRFQHTEDNMIIVEGDGNTYVETFAQFRADCVSLSLAAHSGLQKGYTAEIYIQDGTHSARIDGTTQVESPLDPAKLDVYIAAAAALLAEKTKRDTPIKE